jgi:Domain of unknown function (DUF6458)
MLNPPLWLPIVLVWRDTRRVRPSNQEKQSRTDQDGAAVQEVNGHMGIGASLFLIAIGAILTWAIEVETSGIDLDVVGIILMIVGGLGLLMSLLFWSSFAPFRRDERTVVRERDREIY